VRANVKKRSSGSSGSVTYTLTLLSGASRVLSVAVLVALTLVVAWLGWQAGSGAADHQRRGR
jgi:hypothetical protein